MAKIPSYATTGVPSLNDYLLGTETDNSNVTRNYKVSEVVNTILAALNVGTVTSISTASTDFINTTGGEITTVGSISMSIRTSSGTPSGTTWLRGDGTWSSPWVTPPVDIGVSSSGNPITADATSIKFTGTGIAAGGNSSVIAVISGEQSGVNQLFAGTGVEVPGTGTGNAVVTNNSGVIQLLGGSNVTVTDVSTGTPSTRTFRLDSSHSGGTVTNVLGGNGIDTIINPSSTTEIGIEYIFSNNYINRALDNTSIERQDLIAFNKITNSSVKNTRFRDITADSLLKIKQSADLGDLNKIKNIEPTGFTSTAKVTQMIHCTLADYVGIGVKDPNTLYFISQGGTAFTVNLDTSNVSVSGGGPYALQTTVDGVVTSPASFTGPVGAQTTMITSVVSSSGSTITNTTPVSTTITIADPGGGNTSYTAPLSSALTATSTASGGGGGGGGASNSIAAILNLTGSGTYSSFNGINGDANQVYQLSIGNGSRDPSSGYSSGTTKNYGFNTQITIIASQLDSYEFYDATSGLVAEPTYDGNIYNAGSATYSGTVTSGGGANQEVNTTNHVFVANIRLKPRQATISVSDGTTLTGDPDPGIPEYSLSIASNNPNTNFPGSTPGFVSNMTPVSGATITGLDNVGNTGYGWSYPTFPVVITGTATGNYVLTTTPTYTYSSANPGTITGGVDGANTVTLSGGVITFTSTAPVVMRMKYNISGITGATSQYTLDPSASDVLPTGVSTAAGTFATETPGTNYSIDAPTININNGYHIDNFAVTTSSGSNPLSSTMPAGGGIAEVDITGNIVIDSAEVKTISTSSTVTPRKYIIDNSGGGTYTVWQYINSSGAQITSTAASGVITAEFNSYTIPLITGGYGTVQDNGLGTATQYGKKSYRVAWVSGSNSTTQTVAGTQNTDSQIIAGTGATTCTLTRLSPRSGSGYGTLNTTGALSVSWTDQGGNTLGSLTKVSGSSVQGVSTTLRQILNDEIFTCTIQES